jgi:hypothetical protein
MEVEKKSEMDKVREILTKSDPMITMMAIMRLSEVDSGEVKEIKEFLSAHKPEAIKYAIAELNQEFIFKEVDSLSNQLNVYDKKIVMKVAAEMRLAALCHNGVHCIGTSIYPMECVSSVYARQFGLDELYATLLAHKMKMK